MKRILLLLVALVICSMSYAALTGIKTIPGNYATLTLAIADLNIQGVGAGGVTFNVAAGHTETLAAPLSITVTGTNSDQIIFQKSGSGANPLITAYIGTATPASAIQDGMWNLVGSDYVTIDGIDLFDPNSTNPATMEYGFALFKASVTDGSQYNTFKNCVVTLSRVNNATGSGPSVDGSRAITVSNALSTTQTTAVTPTLATGTNSFNKIYTNTLQNCNIGIALIGYAGATPFTLCDFGNDIGGSSISTGNSIINYGGATLASNPAAGVRTLAQYDLNISYNIVNNNNGSGANHPSTLRGIYLNTATSANCTVSNNILTISSGSTTSQLSVIENAAGSTAAGNTININNNTVAGTYTTATTGIFYGIYNSSSAATVNMNSNTFTSVTLSGTGILNGIETGSPTSAFVNNNNFSAISRTGIGAIYVIKTTSPTNLTISGNIIDGVAQNAVASTGLSYGFYGNSSSVNVTVNNNIIRNMTSTGTSSLYGAYEYGITGLKTYQGNQIYGFSTVGGTIYGIREATGSTNDYSNNQIYNLTCTGGTAGAIYGIYPTSGTTNNIYKNRIYNLSLASTGPALYAIYLGGGTTNNVYNNFISDLRTPASAATISLVGIYASSGTTANVFYNTVYLNATSSGANFGSAALYASTTPTLDMRNNILVNMSTPNGTGVTAAYRRSGAALTTYSANSNANAFYAGTTEDATHAVYYDGTTPYAFAAYQTLVGPSKDAVSFRELPPFVNIATTPNDLHMLTSTATLCESGGLQITSPFAITDDIDGAARTSIPDVGADEFAGIASGVINPSGFTASVFSSQQINLGFSLNPSGNNVIIVWNATGIFTSPAGTPPSVGGSLAGGTLLYNGLVSPVIHSGLTGGTAYYYKAFSYNGSSYSAGSTASGTPSVAPPTAFTATSFSPTQINLAYTLNAQANNVVIATAATSTFGTPVNGTVLNVNDPITGGGTVIYVGPLAAFSHTGLSASTVYYYKVWSKDAYTYYSVTGASANATTPCTTISSFPFTESFATALGCWSFSEAVAGSSVHWGTTTSDISHGVTAAQSGAGTYFARVDIYNATTAYNPYYFTSPAFTLNASAKQLKYYYWLGSGGYTITPVPLTLQVTTNGGSTWTDLYAHTSGNSTFSSVTTAPWTQNIVSLASYAGQTVTFRFVSQSNYGSGFTNQGIDEFIIEDVPSCPAPTAINLTSITNSSAFVGWTGGGVNAQIDYGSVGHAAGTGTIVNSVVNPKQITGLTPNTAYHIFVRQDCGAGGYSAWTGPQLLNTACDPSTLVTENFDAVTIPSLPNCWGKFSSYGSGTTTTILSTSNSTPNCAQLYNSGAATTDNILLISPYLSNLGAGTHELRFYAKSSSVLATTVIVGTMTDPANGATFTPFQTITINNSTFTQGVVSFASYSGSNKYIAFRHPCQTTYSSIYIDDVLWQLLPPCPPPTLLTTTGITGVSAILNWANGQSETMWNVKYGAPGFNPLTEGTLISGITAHPYTLSPPLSASTTYDWYVNADCGGAKILSAWGGPATFTTPCASAVVPFTEGFESATFPPSACWSNTAVSGTFTWARSTAASGNGSGTGSAFASFFDQISGSKYDLKTMPFDITGIAAPLLKFNYAYATYAGEADQMDVYSSTNNGSTWSLMLTMPGGTSGILNTGGTTTASFVPTAAQWGTKTLPIPAGTNMIKFTATSAYGNNLYLDNIQVYQLLAHDVAATGINLNQVVPSGLQSPTATVMNEGTNAETFNVTLTIGAYTSTQTVTALGAGLSQVVTFAPWTAVNGNYTATLTTMLAGDLYAANNTLSKSLKVMALNKEVYGYTTFSTSNNGPIKFNLNNPGTLTEIVNEYPTITYPASGTWANGLWYAAIYASASPYNLVTYNTTTGARTVIGDMGVNINAMSYNTENNTMYGAGYNGATSLLYTINLTTGNATLVGTIGTYLIINMAINNAGVCYATDLTGDILGTINLTTGAFSAIGSIGFNAQYAQDMEFDRETGELFMAAYGATGELRWVDKTNGSTLVIGQFQGGAEVTGFAIPYSNNKTLNLTVQLESLQSTTPGSMREAQDFTPPSTYSAKWGAGVADKITVELRDVAVGHAILGSYEVNLLTNGTATVTVPGTLGGSYLIVVKNRNSIDTWSNGGVSFAGSTISYNFSSGITQAYGSNMKSVAGGLFAFYGGNANASSDAKVDGTDMALVDNGSTAQLKGYIDADVTGDGKVDGSDMALIDNNSTALVKVVPVP